MPSASRGDTGCLKIKREIACANSTSTSASVRTLALVEVLFAQAISRFVFKQPTSAREACGIVLIVAGVLLLIWAY